MDKLLRGLRMQPGTINEETRTAEVVFTSGASVKRYDYEGAFWETLIVNEESVNLERLKAGAPLLDTHSTWDTSDVIGVVEDAWIDADQGLGYARVRFAEGGKADEIFKKVKDGILRNLSVGYGIDDSEFILNDAGERVLEVREWTPHEISVVPVPADAKSQFRSLTDEVPEIAVERAKTEDDEDPKEENDQEEDQEISSPEGGSESETEAEALAGDADDEADDQPTTENNSDETDSDVDGDHDQEEDDQPGDQRMAPADIVRRCLTAGVAERAPEFIEKQPTAAEFERQLAEVSEIRKLCTQFQKDEKQYTGKDINQVRALIMDSLVDEDDNIQSRFASDSSMPTKQESQSDPKVDTVRIYSNYQ